MTGSLRGVWLTLRLPSCRRFVSGYTSPHVFLNVPFPVCARPPLLSRSTRRVFVYRKPRLDGNATSLRAATVSKSFKVERRGNRRIDRSQLRSPFPLITLSQSSLRTSSENVKVIQIFLHKYTFSLSLFLKKKERKENKKRYVCEN